MSEMHGFDGLERDLRAWLAAEAAAIEPPPGLAERMSALEPPTAARTERLAWARLPRRMVLIGVTLLLVAALVAGLVLAGLLPFGPDCSRVSIETVRAAADAVPGYRYTANATELTYRLEPPEFTYSTATIEVAGAYEAPDAWSLEILRLDNPRSPIPPNGALWILSEAWDAFLYAEGAGYARATAASRYTRQSPGGLLLEQMGPNRVADLLLGRPFRMGLPGQEAYPLSWSVAAREGTCMLAAAIPTVIEELGGTWELVFEVDPETLLPATAAYRLATPEVPLVNGSGAPATDVRWQFVFDYSETPDIEPPTDPEVPPVTEERAMDDAANAGAGVVTDRNGLGRGATELWVVRGSDAVAVLRYEGGLLAATELLDRADDVTVRIMEGEEARFLVVVVNDPRVSHVRVALSASDTLRVPPEDAPTDDRPLFIVDAEGLGDVVTWWAYDEDDRELVVSPRPPG